MAKTKKCSECLAEIPKAAKKCQHCGSKQKGGIGIIKGTFVILLAIVSIPIIISSIIGSSDNSSNSVGSTQITQEQKLAELVKRNKATRLKMAADEYSKDPKPIIAKLNKMLSSGQAKEAMAEARKYSKAGIKDTELTNIIAKAKVIINKKIEKNLLAEVKSVPSSDLEKNRDIYAKLAKLDPDKKQYQVKRDHYQKKIDKQKIEMAARLIAFGDKPKASGWDGSYYPVERYLKKVANDPDSIDIVGCTGVFYNNKGWLVGCRYRGKNAFGGMVLNANWFTINHGRVIKVDDSNAYKWN